MFSALSLTTPTTSRFGLRVSSTAKPSLRNSGFHARSAPELISCNLCRNLDAVPTGTVDLPTTNPPGFTNFAIASRAEFT